MSVLDVRQPGVAAPRSTWVIHLGFGVALFSCTAIAVVTILLAGSTPEPGLRLIAIDLFSVFLAGVWCALLLVLPDPRQKVQALVPVVVLAVLMGSTAALFQEDAGMRFAALMARDRMDAIAMQADPPTGGKNNTSECLNGFCLDSVGKYGDMTVLELDPFSTDWVEPRDDTVYALINAPEQPNNPQLKAHLGDGYLRNIKNLGGSWYFVNYNHYGG